MIRLPKPWPYVLKEFEYIVLNEEIVAFDSSPFTQVVYKVPDKSRYACFYGFSITFIPGYHPQSNGNSLVILSGGLGADRTRKDLYRHSNAGQITDNLIVPEFYFAACPSYAEYGITPVFFRAGETAAFNLIVNPNVSGYSYGDITIYGYVENSLDAKAPV